LAREREGSVNLIGEIGTREALQGDGGWLLLTIAFVMKEKYNKVWNGEDKDFYGG